jgi:Transcriptional regulators
MEKSLHYLLMANHMTFQKQFFSNVKNLGLTTGQPKILDYLQDHDGSAQKEIAKGCHIEPATLTSLLAGMEKKELITRSTKEGDRRTLYVSMTEKGREMQSQISIEFARLEQAALQDFSKEEQSQLILMLSHLYDNMIKNAGCKPTRTENGDN